MKLVKYRHFRSHEETTPTMSRLYGRFGLTESFLKDVKYSGPHELLWIVLARRFIGKFFSRRLRKILQDNNLAAIEERSKRLYKIFRNLTREGRSPGLEPSPILKAILGFFHIRQLYPIGSIRDWYGIRIVTESDATSRDNCYKILEKVLGTAEIADSSEILGLVDYLSCNQARYDESNSYIGRYESIHLSFIYFGVPIEIQIRDTNMDRNAKTVVKRIGVDF